jgi:transcriptional regulator of acetoin/glycerol metabolism
VASQPFFLLTGGGEYHKIMALLLVEKMMPSSKWEAVIRELEQHGNISRAARAVGYDRTTLIRWSKKYKNFGVEWRKALKKGRK